MSQQCKLKYTNVISQGVDVEIRKRVCDRPAYKDGLCYFHYDDPRKSQEKMYAEIRRLSESSKPDLDLSHFVFPKDDFKFPIAFRKPTFFEHTKFHGKASFRGMQFPSYTSFLFTSFLDEADFGDDGNHYEKFTHFSDKVIFNNAEFHKRAWFRGCKFSSPPEFNGTIFHEKALFVWSHIAYGSESQHLEFRQVEFRGEADLAFKGTERIRGIAFRNCNLEGLKIGSLPLSDTEIIFENISKWYEKRKFYQWRRNKIRDEEHLKGDPVRLAGLYEYLEEYFYKTNDYALARHFYIGQLVAQRKDSNFDRVSRFVNWLYQTVSNYGESILRPALMLVSIWIIFPFILLFAGFKVTPHDSLTNDKKSEEVNYDTEDLFDSERMKYFVADYKSAFGANLSLSTFDRRHEFSPPSDSLQKGILVGETVLNLIFASLIVVAVRRKFTPKRPTGS